MKEVCLAFKHSGEAMVFRAGRSFGDGIVKEIRKDGDSITILAEDGDERVFPNPDIVWYVEEPVIGIIQ